MRAPADPRTEADHAGKGMNRRSWVRCERIDLDLKRIRYTEVAADEIVLDPVAELVLRFISVGSDMLLQEVSEVLRRGIRLGKDRRMPIVDWKLAGGFLEPG